MPFQKFNQWLTKEKQLGGETDCAVLATVSSKGTPHSRVVSIRKIEDGSVIFFTQKNTRKVTDLLSNPYAAMTFYLAKQQSQVTLEGKTELLSNNEREFYWQSLSKERQLRFMSNALTSNQSISDANILETNKMQLEKKFQHQSIPLSEFYFGIRLVPEYMLFYALKEESFSESVTYSKIDNGTWGKHQQ
jgi:pyridoxamine 5'-phosphate oxidase